MYKAIIHEARYGDTVPDTNRELITETISDIFDWFLAKDPIRKELFIDVGYMSVGIPTNQWGAVYKYSLSSVSDTTGVHFKCRTMKDVAHVSQRMKEVFNQYIDILKKEKELPLIK